MQSVDESYEFVSLEADNGMAGGDRKQPAERAAEPEPEPERAAEPDTVFDHYPPQPLRELAEENGIHYFEDGHFYTEVSNIIMFRHFNHHYLQSFASCLSIVL